MLSESAVSANNPLFPRFVSPALESGGRPLLDLLAQETVDEPAALNLLRGAKALGDGIDAEREEREARLREAGFEEPDEEQRRINLATYVALLDRPRKSDPRLRGRAAKSPAELTKQ
ncbi:MAG: hypothetical protein OXK74_07770 [Gemmatimonadota bacterium]|nr:hypothetical protein [Gemmatimonadota bacterium]